MSFSLRKWHVTLLVEGCWRERDAIYLFEGCLLREFMLRPFSSIRVNLSQPDSAPCNPERNLSQRVSRLLAKEIMFIHTFQKEQLHPNLCTLVFHFSPLKTFHKYYVYIVECIDKSYYSGVTNNLDRRLEEHNFGRNPKSFTFKRRSVILRYFDRFQYINDAITCEKQMKG